MKRNFLESVELQVSQNQRIRIGRPYPGVKGYPCIRDRESGENLPYPGFVWVVRLCSDETFTFRLCSRTTTPRKISVSAVPSSFPTQLDPSTPSACSETRPILMRPTSLVFHACPSTT